MSFQGLTPAGRVYCDGIEVGENTPPSEIFETHALLALMEIDSEERGDTSTAMIWETFRNGWGVGVVSFAVRQLISALQKSSPKQAVQLTSDLDLIFARIARRLESLPCCMTIHAIRSGQANKNLPNFAKASADR